jgi:hypothetical protein
MHKLQFLGILQTHTTGNNPAAKKMPRYCGAEKPEVVLRCVTSLVQSMNYAASMIPEFEFTLKVFDDHSDKKHIKQLKEVLGHAQFTVEWENLETTGVMPSILACYQHGLQHGKELVYFMQDDYLYYESCIFDMMNAYLDFSTALKSPVGIYPYNDPYLYHPINCHITARLVQGRTQYWRTVLSSASCFMTHHSVIQAHFDLFEQMGRSDPYDAHTEDKSINKLWQERGLFMFAPMQSIALHMGYDTEKDPYIDWYSLWNQFETNTKTYKLPPKALLNIGCGSPSISIPEELTALYQEVRVDIDPKVRPDVITSATDLSVFMSGSVAAIYTSHTLEHFMPHEAKTALHEYRRVLKQKGTLFIRVPNIQEPCRIIGEGRADEILYHSPGGAVTSLDMLYGQHEHVRRSGIFMSHKNGFTQHSLQMLLEEINFKKISVRISDDKLELFAEGSK